MQWRKRKDFPFQDLTPGRFCLKKEALDQFKVLKTKKVSWSRDDFNVFMKVFKFYESKEFVDNQGESLLCCQQFQSRSAAITDALRCQSKEDILGDKVHLFIGSTWEHPKVHVQSNKLNWHVRVGDAWHKDAEADSYIVEATSPTSVTFVSSESNKEQVMNIKAFVEKYKLGTPCDATDSRRRNATCQKRSLPYGKVQSITKSVTLSFCTRANRSFLGTVSATCRKRGRQMSR